MLRYVVQRILLMIPTIVGVSLLITGMLQLLPGDAVDILVANNSVGGGTAAFNALVDRQLAANGVAVGSFQQRRDVESALVDKQLRASRIDPSVATVQQRRDAKSTLSQVAFKDDIRTSLGLKQGFIAQWWQWTSNALRGDLGTSITGKVSISNQLVQRVPVSLELGLLAIFWSAVVAIPVGIISAVRQDTWIDYVSRSAAVGMLALPSFFVATLHIALASSVFHYSTPVYYEKLWEHPWSNLQMMLPASIILGFALSGTLMRLTRTQMLEVLRQDYIRTARAKGVHESGIVLSHALRNALFPVITIIGIQISVVIGGSLVLESIYGLPGVANYLFIAIKDQDYPVIMAVNLLVAVVIIIANLIVDVSYAVLDPRVTLS